MSQSQAHLEQKLKDLIEEAERWDLDPKQASLWWTSSHADEKMDDMTTRTRTRLHKLPFEKKVKTLGYTFNQTRRTQDSFEERMQSANNAWWRDVKMYRSECVPWRITCRRSVEHVNSVFCFGSESWSWCGAIMDRIQGWQTKAMRCLFGFKRKEDETL